jgi:hypothetical protein
MYCAGYFWCGSRLLLDELDQRPVGILVVAQAVNILT